MLKGQFTVDASGKKVSFAKGNLWYGKVGDAAAATFNFEDDQYGFSTTISGSYTYWNADHISYFQWASTTEKTIDYTLSKLSTETSLFTNAADNPSKPNSEFTVSGITGFWRTLSQAEWEYLLNTRSGTGNERYFKGRLDNGDNTYINGVFLIPDNFTWPTSVTKATGINTSTLDYTTNNTYSMADFEKLEEAGIVFLPVAGYISSTGRGKNPSISTTSGIYWTANQKANTTAYRIYLGKTYFYFKLTDSSNNCDKGSGSSIRLVGDL